jgi:hypothetical protein
MNDKCTIYFNLAMADILFPISDITVIHYIIIMTICWITNYIHTTTNLWPLAHTYSPFPCLASSFHSPSIDLGYCIAHSTMNSVTNLYIHHHCHTRIVHSLEICYRPNHQHILSTRIELDDRINTMTVIYLSLTCHPSAFPTLLSIYLS